MTDWDIFRLACQALINGSNPYLVGTGEMRFYNPPWILIPLLPLAQLPPIPGLLANALVSTVSLVVITRSLKMGIWETFLVLISPMHLQSLVYGNPEWIPLLGVLMPPPLALVLYMTKPQATFGLVLLLLVNEWKRGRWRALGVTVAPTLILALVSVMLWGLPPVPGPNNPGLRSIFPYSLIVGLPALALALRSSDRRLASFVGPFVSPYVTFHGYLPALFAFKGKWMALAVGVAFVPVLLGIVA